MSNTRHTQIPAAAMNGAKKPTSLEILATIAGGMQALAQDATRRPVLQPAQRIQCAVCMGLLKGWEVRHQDDIQALAERHQHAMDQITQTLNDPATPEEDRQKILANIPNLQAMAAQFGNEIGDPLPQVQEMVCLATLPEIGTTGVCPGHLPAAKQAEPPRKPFYVAYGGLTETMVREARTGVS